MTEELLQKEHNKFGGSTADKWSVCYGFAREMEKLPPHVPGPPALKGTAIHTGILERYVRAQLARLKDGTEIEVRYDDIPHWPTDGPTIAEEFWQVLFKNVLEEIATGKQIYIERKLTLFPDRDAGGTADVLVLYRNDKGKAVLWCGDLKSGYVLKKPSDEQMKFYLAAAYLTAQRKGTEIDIFNAFIWQPSNPEPFTTHKFSKSSILAAVKKYDRAIIESQKDRPRYKTGDHCQYCRAKPTCLAFKNALDKKFDVEVRAPLPPVEGLSDEALLKVFTVMDEVESYFSDVRKHLVSRFANGAPLPGLKLVEGVSKRAFKDDPQVVEKLRAEGIEPTVPKLIGVGECEKRLKAAGKPKEEIGAIMYSVTERKPPRPKVTLESDPRPALEVKNPADLLIGLDDESGEG